MKRRLLYFIPILAFVVITATTMLAPRPAYAVVDPGSPAPANQTNAPKLDTCPDRNPLSWLICPVIDAMVGAVGLLDNFINSAMSVGSPGASSDPNQIFCSKGSDDNAKKSCNAYYDAWRSVRDIALGLMAIAGVIVLIAQALGFEILDAYTIRKVLPRLLIAALGITLSWQLMRFFVLFSNELAYGIRFLIYKPFSNIPNVSLGSGSSFVAILLSFSALALLEVVGLLSFIGTALLAVFVAVLVLILRQLLIILLIIMAPIAIVAYVLPNTKKLYDLWWDSFSKALLMFALIAGLIAIGRVFSAVTALNSSNPINQLAGFAAYFLPYFLIPFTFKFAGGAIRGVGGFVNDRHRGAFDRLSQFRSNQASKNLKRVRAGQRWNQDFGRFKNPITGKQTSVGRMANKAAMNLFDQDELLPYRLGKQRGDFMGVPGFKRGAASMQDKLDNRAILESAKGVQAIDQAGGMHYQGWRAVAGNYEGFEDAEDRNHRLISDKIAEAGFVDKATGVARAPSSLADFQSLSSILQSSSDDKVRLGGEQLARHAGTLASIKSNQPDMEYADAQVMGAIGLSAAGRAEPEQLASIANSVSARLNAGVAARTLTTAQKVGTRNRPDIRDGHGVIAKKTEEGKIHYESAYSPENYRSNTAIGSITSVKGSDWTGAKAESVKAAKDTLVMVAKGERGTAADNRSDKAILDDKSTIEDSITQGITSPYNDAGQRKAWLQVARGADWPPERIERLQAQSQRVPDIRDQTVLGGEPEPPAPTPEA